MEKYLLALLLFGISFVWWPIDQLEIIKVLMVEICIGGLIFLQRKKLLVWPAKLSWLGILVFILLWQLPGIWGTDKFLGNMFRFQGWWLYLLMAIWAYLAGTIANFDISKYVIWYMGMVGITAMVLPGNESGRALGTMGEPNMLAQTMVFAWPWLLKRPVRERAVGLFLAVIVWWMAVSRSAVVAVVIQWLGLVAFKTGKNIRLSSGLMTAVMVGSMFLPFFSAPRIWENRLEIWRTAWHAGLEKPMTGWGFGGVEQALADTGLKLRNNLRYMYVDSAHNVWLDFWVQGGLGGVLVLGAIFVSVVKKMTGTENFSALLSLFGTTVCLSFNPGSVVNLVCWWWLLGTGLAGLQTGKTKG